MRKKLISTFLVLIIMFTIASPSVAAVDAAQRYGDVEANYVEELVEIELEVIETLPLIQIEDLFEKAFDDVPASAFTEEEMRNILSALAYGLQWSAQRQQTRASSTTGSYYYNGDYGIAWLRDTNRSPFTLAELAGGYYSLEYDYVSKDTILTMLAASSSQINFNTLVNAAATSITSEKLATLLAPMLEGLTVPTKVSATALNFVLNLGATYLSTINRSFFYNNANNTGTNQYMKVEFMYNQNSNSVTRIVSFVNKGTLPNPSGNLYGTWYKDQIAINYSYAF